VADLSQAMLTATVGPATDLISLILKRVKRQAVYWWFRRFVCQALRRIGSAQVIMNPYRRQRVESGRRNIPSLSVFLKSNYRRKHSEGYGYGPELPTGRRWVSPGGSRSYRDHYPPGMRVPNPYTDLTKQRMLRWHRILGAVLDRR
jgi:hypothetical protein